MKVTSLGANKTEISTDRATIFVSYKTPVAAIVNGNAYRTEQKWSVTTSKHITQWLNGRTADSQPQAFFDALLD